MQIPRRTFQDLQPKAQNEKNDNFSTFQLFRTSLVYQTREFFNNSTLHGVRYIAESGRPVGER